MPKLRHFLTSYDVSLRSVQRVLGRDLRHFLSTVYLKPVTKEGDRWLHNFQSFDFVFSAVLPDGPTVETKRTAVDMAPEDLAEESRDKECWTLVILAHALEAA